MDGFAGFMQAVDLGAQLWSAQRARAYGQKMQIQNQNWMERMSNTAVSRHVDDLKRAGLNPMLAHQPGGQASSPQSSPAPTFRDYEPGSINSGAMAALMVAKAQARKLNAEATLTESEIPFSAINAQERSKQLAASTDKLVGEARSALARGEIDLTNKQAVMRHEAALIPLIEEWKRIELERERLGLAESRAMAEFYNMVGGYAKWIEIAKSLVPSIGIGIGSMIPKKGVPRQPRSIHKRTIRHPLGTDTHIEER